MRPDIQKIVNSTNSYNFHSHSEFCDGRDSMKELAEAAVSLGFTEWGVSPHGPVSVESPCNMSRENMEVYRNRIGRLAESFPQLNIWCGIEADYINESEGPAQIRENFPWLDFIIGSVHFIPTRQGKWVDIDGSPQRFVERLASDFEGDLRYVVDTFWKQTSSMIKHGGQDIIGHIDKIALNASVVCPEIEMTQWYRRGADEAIRLAVESGQAVEINTKQRKSVGRFFPHPRYWARLARAGVLMPIDSDAHYADRVDESRPDAKKLLTAILTLDRAPDATLIIVTAADEVKKYSRRGIIDLWEVVSERPEILPGATVADKVIGRGAAALLIAGGVSQVYGEIVSRHALELFRRFPSIKVDYGTLVDAIVNREGNGPCPVETLTAGVTEVGECLNLIGDFIEGIKEKSR